MSTLYVARSAKLSRWAADVGFGKHIYKVGIADEDPKALAAAGWAGESDWTIVKKQAVEGIDEAEAIARLAHKEKPIEPHLYPKLRGAEGMFRVAAEHVENHIIVKRALAGESGVELKLRPADFAEYLIANATR